MNRAKRTSAQKPRAGEPSVWLVGEEPLAPRQVHEPKSHDSSLSEMVQPAQPHAVKINPFEENIAYSVMQPLAEPSPIDRLWWLQDGWDGGRAERFSRIVLRNSIKVWNVAKKITPNDLPRVSPSPDSYVIFSWSDHYPVKELQLSVLQSNKPAIPFLSRWVLRGKIGKKSGTCSNIDNLKEIMADYSNFSIDDGQ